MNNNLNKIWINTVVIFFSDGSRSKDLLKGRLPGGLGVTDPQVGVGCGGSPLEMC